MKIYHWFVVVVVVRMNSALMNLFLKKWRRTYGHIWILYGPYLRIHQTLITLSFNYCMKYQVGKVTNLVPSPCFRCKRKAMKAKMRPWNGCVQILNTSVYLQHCDNYQNEKILTISQQQKLYSRGNERKQQHF